MEKETLTLLCCIVACILGICTFVVGMKGRAANDGTNDGTLIQKINQALAGIDELKQDFKAQANTERKLELRVQTHDEQIKALFKAQEGLTETNKILALIAENIAQVNRRDDH